MIEIRLDDSFECSLLMQVLKQDECLKNTNAANFIHFDNKDLSLISRNCPSISPYFNKIYIRGKDKDNDFLVARALFNSNTERDEFKVRVVKLFTDYNSRNNSYAKNKDIFILE